MKILLVEDERVSRRLLEAVLCKWGYEVLTAGCGREAWEILQQEDAPSLVISDWIMPDMDGLELCGRIRAMETENYIYCIILTAKSEREDVVKGLEAGADDYLIKPFDPEELRCRVKIGERIITLERRILVLAYTDPLTGVLNRRSFMQRLLGELNRSARQELSLALIMADIDHFKKVNDDHGHRAGDHVLRVFAENLRASVREYDFVGRYGGEEFIICLPGVDCSRAVAFAERIRSKIQDTVVTLPDSSGSLQITVSLGLSCFRGDSGDNADSLLARADDAVYRAKREGRNRVCVAPGD